MTREVDGDVYWQQARHPKAGIAIGAAILAFWAGAVAIELATDDSAGERGGQTSQTRFEDAHGTWPARPGSSYVPIVP